jgi:cytochrome c556
MESTHELPYSEVTELLKDIISKRTERNKHKKNRREYTGEDIETQIEIDMEEYRKKDAELDALLEQLAQQFEEAPTRGTERFPETLPPAEDEDEFHPTSESNFNAAEEIRRAVPGSVNETPADLDTTPRVGETPEQKREREYLESIYGGKISAYSMKQKTLYNRLKKAPSQLFRSISSVSRKVNPFKCKKSKKTRKYRRT